MITSFAINSSFKQETNMGSYNSKKLENENSIFCKICLTETEVLESQKLLYCNCSYCKEVSSFNLLKMLKKVT